MEKNLVLEMIKMETILTRVERVEKKWIEIERVRKAVCIRIVRYLGWEIT